MNDLREELLAGSAFAGYQNRQVGRCDLYGHFEGTVEGFARADYAESLFE